MTATLAVLGGPLAGSRIEIPDSSEEILVGSDPDCRFALDLPGVSPIHARLTVDSSGLAVHDTRSPRGVYVNDARVEASAPIHDGDVLWLGPPGDAASVMIQCRVAPPEAGGDDFVLAEPQPEDAVDPLGDLGDLMVIAAPQT
ncbi:MAG TPA: FHA domain-containing protein, partial [Vicinamibacteria bacterium]|nr:FHA domain-containing protein [Vicinamibacteria bacterium]